MQQKLYLLFLLRFRQDSFRHRRIGLAMKYDIEQLISVSMESMDVSGASVVIVKDDEIVFIDGFGYRNIQKTLPVTPDTFFLQGSVTKTFTSLSAMLLVESGRLDLDQPVVKYLPWFTLTDSWAGVKATPRDFLAHRSGFGEHDSVWFEQPDISRKELVRDMSSLPMSSELRTAWDYSNHGYALIGLLVQELTGEPWEDFVVNSILRPSGMMESTFGGLSEQVVEKAEPIYDEPNWPDVLREVPAALNPAGGLKSSAREMAQWVRLILNRGSVDGIRVVSEESVAAVQSPQTVLPWAGESEGEYGLNGCYGLGWFREVFRGHLHLFHEGRYPGYSSMLSIFPEERFGIAVMCNRTCRFPMVAARVIAEKSLGSINP